MAGSQGSAIFFRTHSNHTKEKEREIHPALFR